MKIHTTNYTNTFIIVADDCPELSGEIPPSKGEKRTAASIQFEMISKHPYQFTSDDVLFQVYADKKELTKSELQSAREQFFSKGQPCFRASPLSKRYGWGIHYNEEGKMAIYGCETEAYQHLSKNKSLTVLKAMRTSR